MAHGICKLCHGMGSLMCRQNGKYEWHTCPACDGLFTRNEIRGPQFIRTHSTEQQP